MPFSRQRAASADSEAPASQTLVLSSDAYPLQLLVPSSTFRAKRSKARVLFLPPPVLCVMCPQCPVQESVFFQGSKSRQWLIYKLVYGVKSNLDRTGSLCTAFLYIQLDAPCVENPQVGILHKEHG